MQRRRPQRWWAVFFCASLAMGVYIAFEVLDLDGSDLPKRLFGTAMAAEPSQAETERLLHQAPSIPEAPGHIPVPLALRSVPDSPRLIPSTIPATCAARHDQIRPRGHVSRETFSGPASTEDPA